MTRRWSARLEARFQRARAEYLPLATARASSMAVKRFVDVGDAQSAVWELRTLRRAVLRAVVLGDKHSRALARLLLECEELVFPGEQ